MYSVIDDGMLLPPGCPIRNPPGQCFFPAHRSFSQVNASFFAYWCQGIHQQPLLAWPKYFWLLPYEVFTSCNNMSFRYDSYENHISWFLRTTIFFWMKMVNYITITNFISLSVDFYQWFYGTTHFIFSECEVPSYMKSIYKFHPLKFFFFDSWFYKMSR
jgi:hypothetical protein